MLIAGSGNETLSATFSAGNDTLTAGSGHDLLISGTGADTFIGGSGQATINRRVRQRRLRLHQSPGRRHRTIQGIFDPTSIKIDLQGYGSGAIGQALASQTVQQGSVTIGLSDGTKITFQDVTSLNQSNFV